MKLVKKQTLEPGQTASAAGGLLGRTVDRRTFLRGTGLAAGGAAVATTVSMRMMRRADAAAAEAGDGEIVTRRMEPRRQDPGHRSRAEHPDRLSHVDSPAPASPLQVGGNSRGFRA